MLLRTVAIDVGGTFIDFVLLDEETGELVIEKQPSTARDARRRVARRAGPTAGRLPAARPPLPRHDRRDQRRPSGARRTRRPDHHGRLPRRPRARPRQPARGLQRPLPAAGSRSSRGISAARCRSGSRADGVGARAARPRRARPRGRPASSAEGVEAIAICFLHAYARPTHERLAAAARPGAPSRRSRSPPRTRSRPSGASSSARRRPSSTHTSSRSSPTTSATPRGAAARRRLPALARPDAVERRRHLRRAARRSGRSGRSSPARPAA